ncbi:hypothetical protein V6N13_046471 [Hibiscus sabdariffa]
MEVNKLEDHHQEEEEAVESDDVELLKTRISSHPLYGKLVENHLNCLKNMQYLQGNIESQALSQLLLSDFFGDWHTVVQMVSGIGNGGRNSKGNQRQAENYNSSNNIKKNSCSSSMQLSQSELDLFMEGYCSALSKLKEAMEEPQLESFAFINGMHSQLRDLVRANPLSPDVFLEAETNDSK